MATITETRVTKKGQRGVVHCDKCGIPHQEDATIITLCKIVSQYETILCKACASEWRQPIGRTDVCCWLTDHGLYGWSGTRIATEEEMESIYRAMRILDAGLAQMKKSTP